MAQEKGVKELTNTFINL